jgi:formiminotetrahydrofolate cyclodeaminase
MYKNKTLKKYLSDLAAKLPAPGGGSAAALTCAMAASLVSMVVNFTIGKPKYAKYGKELQDILGKSLSLSEEFLRLTDLDVSAYKSGNMRDSLNVPFMVCRLSFEGIKLCVPLIKKGNVNLISDVAVAAQLFEAGFSAALFNVKINLKAIADKKLSCEVMRELNKKAKLLGRVRRNTEDKVGAIIGR